VSVSEGTSVNFGLNYRDLGHNLRGFAWSHLEMRSGGPSVREYPYD